MKVPVRRALLSVYDKTGLVEFARRLGAAGVELVSSGGTARALRDAGLSVTAVEVVTGAPEMLGGRVKTLHPKIHGGILADRGVPEHLEDLDEHAIEGFDLVVVNLYPFEDTVAAPDVTEAEAIEKIDIGGPAMVRAAAKNHAWVGVVTDPDQYDEVAGEIESGGLTADLRRGLAKRAFFRTAAYDAAIVGWFDSTDQPGRMIVPLELAAGLRYGENPHQEAAAYRHGGGWWTAARQLQGKAMSFNNYGDTEAAWRHVQVYANPACVIVKHANACGVGEAGILADAFRIAWDCDPLSAFGGVIAVNRPLDGATARAVVEAGFVEIVIAPEITGEAAEALSTKPNLRLLAAPPPDPTDLDMRRIDGGFLVQQRDAVRIDRAAWTVPTKREPTPDEWGDLEFAWRVVAYTKSNAVVIARRRAAVGIGAGDQSRVGAAKRAIAGAGRRANGGVSASDAFFPFPDGPLALADAGITAIIQPGGSKGDTEVIDAMDARGIAMVFTHRRHFLH